ncbi:hypothetical protein, partial [Dapis sp. BLCC M229]|uniref:hypothetical protein n=1 Tax=Dapis sp. BLCC M229 TaxID=3400188 RepID=UPI003CF53F10
METRELKYFSVQFLPTSILNFASQTTTYIFGAPVESANIYYFWKTRGLKYFSVQFLPTSILNFAS